jgi:hypothetical protein
MSGPEVLVPLTAFICLSATILAIAYMRNKENMALIERGINPRNTEEAKPKPFFSLKYGLMFVGCGLGLFVAYLMDIQMRVKVVQPNGDFYYQDNAPLYFALIAVGGGIGLVISYFIEKKHWLDKRKTV